MKTFKTILATLTLFLAISVMSAQSLSVIKKGTIITVSDKITKAILCTHPSTPTSTIPAINFVDFYVVVDGLNVNSYTSKCASIGKLTIPAGSTVGLPTISGALFSVTTDGDAKNYNSNCKTVE